MKTLALIVISTAALAACAVDSPAPPPRVAGDAVIEAGSNPFRWMVGAWGPSDGFGGYHNVPPFVAHNVTADYTIAEDEHGRIIGHYHELSADGHPLVDFDDTWEMGSTPDASGNVALHYERTTSDGFFAIGDGVSHGPSTNVAGTYTVDGTLTFPDGSSRGWHSFGIATTNTGLQMGTNDSIALRPGSRIVYFGFDGKPVTDGGPLGIAPLPGAKAD